VLFIKINIYFIRKYIVNITVFMKFVFDMKGKGEYQIMFFYQLNKSSEISKKFNLCYK
jgi:hypothetical protein